MTEREPIANIDDRSNVSIILAAVDASPGASLVIEQAARMTRTRPSSQLHLIHVFRTGFFDRSAPGMPSNADLVEEAKQHLEGHVRMAKRQCNVPVTGHFAVGNPATEVVRLAKALDSDVIVVGTHDYIGLERLLLGSVAETIVRRASCSVLVVRRREHSRTDVR